MGSRKQVGFTLLELIIAIAVLSIVAMATIPYMQNSIKREREVVLRRNLRTIRKALDAYNIDYATKIGPLDKKEGDMGYPPTLEILVEGIHPVNTDKTIRYLRRIPIDPMTGKADWGFRAVQDEPKGDSWNGKNIFDVYSKSKDKALNGTDYSDW
ncbi:MAG: type II secretion system protein [Acidobacteriota bacterium]